MLAEMGRILRRRPKLPTRDDEGLKRGREREVRRNPRQRSGLPRLVTDPRRGGGREEAETT